MRETLLADPPVYEADPAIEDGRPRRSTFFLVLQRLVISLVGLNLFVLALLVAVTALWGDDAAESGDPAPGPDAVAPATPSTNDETNDGTADPVTDDGGVVAGVDGGIDDAADPVDQEPAISTDSPPYPALFEPTDNEPQPEAKLLGAFVAYLITNYEADASSNDVLATLPPWSSQIRGLIPEVELVHHPGMWSRGTVEYVQNGGHLNGRISLIVVVRQELGIEGSHEPERTETRVMEVRLARGEAGEWTLETIATSGGVPAERPADLSDLAAAVVDHERIDLPDTAAWDIYRGLIDRQLLQVMLDIAERTPYSVVVLQTGHSYNVFGTERVSNHSVGRAVDIYKLESELVVDSHDTSSDFYALSEWIVSRSDIREFGSPWRFPDAVAHTFTNEVHHDHLHIGVNPG